MCFGEIWVSVDCLSQKLNCLIYASGISVGVRHENARLNLLGIQLERFVIRVKGLFVGFVPFQGKRSRGVISAPKMSPRQRVIRIQADSLLEHVGSGRKVISRIKIHTVEEILVR